MKKQIFITLAILMALPLLAAKEKHAVVFSEPENYSCVFVQVGAGGTKLIKVSGIGKNKETAVEKACMNAVHSCIFQGIVAASDGERTPALYPSTSPSVEDQQYFDNFFNNGDWKAFPKQVTSPTGNDMSQVKGGLKVKVEIQVDYNSLRDKLIADGVIQGLDDALEGASKPILIIFPDKNWCLSHGYVLDDDRSNPSYRKALANMDMMTLINTFQDFMKEQKYDCYSVGDALDKYESGKALDEAERADDGARNKVGVLELLASAVKADYALQFYPETKNDGPKTFVVFHIRVINTGTAAPIYTKDVSGTPVYGTAQMTNQLKEAIYNIKDDFLGKLQQDFNLMAENGRKISLEFVLKDDCPINFSNNFNGYTLEKLIFFYINKRVQTKGFTSSGNTPNHLQYEQVYIPLFAEEVDPDGDLVRYNQSAKEFAESIAAMITEKTGQKCRVFAPTLGNARVTVGVN